MNPIPPPCRHAIDTPPSLSVNKRAEAAFPTRRGGAFRQPETGTTTMTGAKMTRTPRDHDAAIRALREEARWTVRAAALERRDKDHDQWRQFANEFMLEAAAYSLAADYLASIVGAVERTSGKARRGRVGR